MSEEYITFEIIVDTRSTSFKPDDIYDQANSIVESVPGMEGDLASGKVLIRPSPSIDPITVAILSLSVAGAGLSYTVVKDYFDRKGKEDEARLRRRYEQEELKRLDDIAHKLEEVILAFGNLGVVSYQVEPE